MKDRDGEEITPEEFEKIVEANRRHRAGEAGGKRAALWGADLRGANLNGANLRGAINADLAMAMAVIVPQGDLIGWKKCQNGVFVKLRIPADSARSNAAGRKCRCHHAEVLEVIGGAIGESFHSPNVKYTVGALVTCHEWDTDRWNECSGGIHFFITREEAETFEY